MTNRENFTGMLRELIVAGVKITEIAEKLGVRKDTIYTWKGSNEKRHISETTATKLLPKLQELIVTNLGQIFSNVDTEEESTKEDTFETYKPGPVLTTKDLAAELGITPKALRRWLRKRFGKAEDGTWTFTQDMATQIKTEYRKEKAA